MSAEALLRSEPRYFDDTELLPSAPVRTLRIVEADEVCYELDFSDLMEIEEYIMLRDEDMFDVRSLVQLSVRKSLPARFFNVAAANDRIEALTEYLDERPGAPCSATADASPIFWIG